MPNTNYNILNHPNLWRFLGFGSGTVGFSCYALSPTFKYMFGEWNWWKIVIYSAVSCIFPCFMLFVKELGLKKNFILKANVCFLVFLGTCIYSFYQDKTESGKNESDYGKVLSLFSFGGFALMSLSFSRQTNIGFEMGVSSFFLTSFFLCAIKINLKVAAVIALTCYVVVYIRSYSDSVLEMQGGDATNVVIEMDGHSLNNTTGSDTIAEDFHFSSHVNSDHRDEDIQYPNQKESTYDWLFELEVALREAADSGLENAKSTSDVLLKNAILAESERKKEMLHRRLEPADLIGE